MNFIAAKEENRGRILRKNTTFYNRGIKISSRRIETFKKRARQQFDGMESAGMRTIVWKLEVLLTWWHLATPQYITYHTPSPASNDDSLLAEKTNHESTFQASSNKTPSQEDNNDPLVQKVENSVEASPPNSIYHTPPPEINCDSAFRALELKEGASSPKSTYHTPLPEHESSDDIVCSEQINGLATHSNSIYCMENSGIKIIGHTVTVITAAPTYGNESTSHPPSVHFLPQTIPSSSGTQLSLPFGSHPRVNETRRASLPEDPKSLARGLRDRGEFAEAVSEYLRLIDLLSLAVGDDSLLVLEALSELAGVYQALNMLPESITTYQRVLDGYKERFGESDPDTLRTMLGLGKVLEESNQYEEAEACYRKAISGFEDIGESAVLDRLNCQGYLGDLLSDMGRYAEALQEQISLLAAYSSLGLRDRKISVLASLLETYIGIEDSQKMYATIRDMQKLLDDRIEIDPRVNPEVLLDGLHLGSVYCQLLEYDLAKHLMSRIIPKLELLDDGKYEIEKLYGYLDYGTLLLRTRVVNRGEYVRITDEAELYLGLARSGLRKLDRRDDPVLAFVDSLMTQLQYDLSELRNSKALSKASLKEILGVESPDSEDELVCKGSRKSGKDSTDADTVSYKYGVSFSMTDITGISLSEFITG
jgi:tetratricopeptide (TPR) repeat protein